MLEHMLNIGAFANITGLTVKALRHYDETGLLTPAEIDPRSRYRRYAPGQVRHAVTVRALRDAGVPLPGISAALDGDPVAVLDRHRADVLARREHEDDAHRAAIAVLAHLAAPVPVVEEVAPYQPYVGRVLRLGDRVDDLDDQRAHAALGELYGILQRDGFGPSGGFWTTLRQGQPDGAEIVCCWPTTTVVPEGWGGPDVEAGALPERRELRARWRVTAADLPEGVLHPAMLALFDALDKRGIHGEPDSVRQIVVDSGEAVDVAITIHGTPGRNG